MRIARLSRTFHLLLALGYLVLGLAAAWHAPHFSQARVAIGIDHHAGHEAAFENECALCTVKTAPQQSVARFSQILVSAVARVPDTGRLCTTRATLAFAGRPRAPPSLFS